MTRTWIPLELLAISLWLVNTALSSAAEPTSNGGVHRFANGSVTSQTMADFRKTLLLHGDNERVATVLQKTLPAMEFVANFRLETELSEFVNSDGTLAIPSSFYGLVKSQDAFLASWSDLVSALRSSTDPVHADLLRSAKCNLDAWQAEVDSEVFAGSANGKTKARRFFAATRSILTQVDNFKGRDRIRRMLGAGLEFLGGTAGDLVHHVLENRLSCRLGSAAHAVLAELARELGRAAETDTTQQKTRIGAVSGPRGGAPAGWGSSTSRFSGGSSSWPSSTYSSHSSYRTYTTYRTYSYSVPSSSYTVHSYSR